MKQKICQDLKVISWGDANYNPQSKEKNLSPAAQRVINFSNIFQNKSGKTLINKKFNEAKK